MKKLLGSITLKKTMTLVQCWKIEESGTESDINWVSKCTSSKARDTDNQTEFSYMLEVHCEIYVNVKMQIF